MGPYDKDNTNIEANYEYAVAIMKNIMEDYPVIKQIKPSQVGFNMDWMSHGAERVAWKNDLGEEGWSYIYDSRRNFYRVISEMVEKIGKLNNKQVDKILDEYNVCFVRKEGRNNLCITDAEEVAFYKAHNEKIKEELKKLKEEIVKEKKKFEKVFKK